VVHVIEGFGYPGVAAMLVLEAVFPFIPSELVLPFVGFLVAQGRFSFLGAMVAATAGSVAAALLLYALERWTSEERLQRFARSYGRFVLVKEEDLNKALDWFESHGGKAVLLGRFVPGVRSVISIPAGLASMPLLRFVAYTAVGSAIWNGALVGLGWALGERWFVEFGVLGALVVGALWFAWQRFRRRGSE
jgi:membrane protein DedA with SNARE-associated domain